MTDKNIAKKEKAIELLKQMDIYAPYIKGFREKGMVCFFERFGGYWADQEPELYEKRAKLISVTMSRLKKTPIKIVRVFCFIPCPLKKPA